MELEELESIVMDLKGKIDNILDTVSNSEKEFNYNKGLEGFKERNSAALSPYYEKLKKLNGDDFDLDKSAYDEYNNDFSDIEEATYVTQLVSEIDNKLAKLKEALDDDHVMVESDGDETKVETHDEVIETPSADADTEAEDESEDDEIAEFEKELDEDYEKYHK